MSRYALEVLVFLVLVLWLFGWLITPVGGQLIHLLLLFVLAAVVIRVLQWQGRRSLP